jgi:hypothetical protein
MNQFLLGVILFAVAACATPSLEPNPSEAVQTSEAVQAKESGGGILAHNAAAKNFDGIEELEAPSVNEIPAEMIPGRPVLEPAIVCERVVPTGSVLPVEVCRHRANIDLKREADQEIFRDIKNNTALGNSRL